MKRLLVVLMLLAVFVSPAYAQDYVYQENATEVATVNTWYEGGYNPDGTVLFDGNWSSFATPQAFSYAEYYFNYTKYENSVSAILQIKTDEEPPLYDYITRNITVNEDCWDYDGNKLIFKLYVEDDDYGSFQKTLYCYNGTWSVMYDWATDWASNDNIYEEGMYWEILEEEGEIGYTPIQATMVSIIGLIMSISIVLLISRELLLEFNISTIVAIVLMAVVFIAFLQVLVGFVYG